MGDGLAQLAGWREMKYQTERDRRIARDAAAAALFQFFLTKQHNLGVDEKAKIRDAAKDAVYAATILVEELDKT